MVLLTWNLKRKGSRALVNDQRISQVFSFPNRPGRYTAAGRPKPCPEVSEPYMSRRTVGPASRGWISPRWGNKGEKCDDIGDSYGFIHFWYMWKCKDLSILGIKNQDESHWDFSMNVVSPLVCEFFGEFLWEFLGVRWYWLYPISLLSKIPNLLQIKG